jgi:hypothetical protein
MNPEAENWKRASHYRRNITLNKELTDRATAKGEGGLSHFGKRKGVWLKPVKAA